jgi:hypothetical protein
LFVHVKFVRPVDMPKDPAGQFVHVVAPIPEYIPIAHRPEQDDVFKPVVAPNVPATHDPQVVVAVKVADVAPGNAYLPAGQVIVPVQVGVFNPVVEP